MSDQPDDEGRAATAAVRRKNIFNAVLGGESRTIRKPWNPVTDPLPARMRWMVVKLPDDDDFE